MKAVTALDRRRVECVSDLTIDRWLLGETPGSDEARRLEEHMKGCTGCASRIGALRGLYSTQVGPAGHEPPVRLDAPPAAAPGQTGAVQFLILRDGLLIGSEFFTPGSYVIGSDARADLQLDGVMPVHARLYFRDGRVAVKAEGGEVLVSGFKVDSCEVRSIDEVLVGPYVLRTRVIRERWSDVHPSPSPRGGAGRGEGLQARLRGVARIEEEGITEQTVIELPVREASPLTPTLSPAGERETDAQTRLTVELWWGDTRREAQSFSRAVTARDFPLWGFDAPDDFVLASPAPGGAFLVHAPPGATTQATLTLAPGAGHAFRAGAMRLTFKVGALLPALPRAKVEGGPVTLLAAGMMAALVAAVFFAPEPEEQAFTPKTFRRYISPVPPPPRIKPDDAKPRTASADPKVSPRARPTRSNAGPRVAAADPLASLKQLMGDRAFKAILDKTKKTTAGRGQGRSLFAGLGPPAGTGKGFDLGIPGGLTGIGAGGAKQGGVLTGKGYGTARVGGLLERPSGTRVGLRSDPTHSIDKDALARAIAEHLSEVSACYERALIRNGGGGGRLSLEWTVTTAGTVSSAKVKSTTLKDGSIATCVLTALKTWRFPQAKGGAVLVSYPFVFQSSDF